MARKAQTSRAVFEFQYAAKFVLGDSKGEIVAPGRYFTAINVHNPTYAAIRFRKKFAIALPGERGGPVSEFFEARLRADEAFDIDPKDIRARARSNAPFVTGFVVIESPVELDVVAVYTAAGQDGTVETLHTDRVPARRHRLGLPDLVPVPGIGGDFARRQGSNLIVIVKNQGLAASGPCMTEVDFYGHGKTSRPTPALSPGATTTILFPIPPNAFDPDAAFQITVDSLNQVVESDESNNVANGAFVG